MIHIINKIVLSSFILIRMFLNGLKEHYGLIANTVCITIPCIIMSYSYNKAGFQPVSNLWNRNWDSF